MHHPLPVLAFNSLLLILIYLLRTNFYLTFRFCFHIFSLLHSLVLATS